MMPTIIRVIAGHQGYIRMRIASASEGDPELFLVLLCAARQTGRLADPTAPGDASQAILT